MDIDGKTASIIVETTWSERPLIRAVLGPTDRGMRVTAQETRIDAKILDYQDVRGLWIELNTKRSQREPEVSRRQMLIPWPAILSIVTGPEDELDADAEELRRLHELGANEEPRANDP